MAEHMPEDLSAEGRDLREYSDELRARHRVIKNTQGDWFFLKHEDILAIACNPEHFSSAVSRFLQIPNGLDGQEHQAYRQLIDKYLTPESISPYLFSFESIAQAVLTHWLNKKCDAVHDLGAVYAVKAQCAWLGWPADLEPKLLNWMKENHAATRSGIEARKKQVAVDFDDLIRLAFKYSASSSETTSTPSITQQMNQEKIDGRLLSEEEKISILRNWTGGDLGSMALCIGVIIAFLATESVKNPVLLRKLERLSDTELEDYIDEILRLDDPFISNRRITTCPVQLGKLQIPKGTRVKLNWTSANRDEAVFNPNEFNPAKHKKHNLVYGVGPHLCPGKTLATWQLRVFIRKLCQLTEKVSCENLESFEREIAPVGGYFKVPIKLIKKDVN